MLLQPLRRFFRFAIRTAIHFIEGLFPRPNHTLTPHSRVRYDKEKRHQQTKKGKARASTAGGSDGVDGATKSLRKAPRSAPAAAQAGGPSCTRGARGKPPARDWPETGDVVVLDVSDDETDAAMDKPTAGASQRARPSGQWIGAAASTARVEAGAAADTAQGASTSAALTPQAGGSSGTRGARGGTQARYSPAPGDVVVLDVDDDETDAATGKPITGASQRARSSGQRIGGAQSNKLAWSSGQRIEGAQSAAGPEVGAAAETAQGAPATATKRPRRLGLPRIGETAVLPSCSIPVPAGHPEGYSRGLERERAAAGDLANGAGRRLKRPLGQSSTAASAVGGSEGGSRTEVRQKMESLRWLRP